MSVCVTQNQRQNWWTNFHKTPYGKSFTKRFRAIPIFSHKKEGKAIPVTGREGP
jgi:hypothetical protein